MRSVAVAALLAVCPSARLADAQSSWWGGAKQQLMASTDIMPDGVNVRELIGDVGGVATTATTAYLTALKQARRDFNTSSLVSRESYNNSDPFYPGCLLFDNANRLGSREGCAFLKFYKGMTTGLPQIIRQPMSADPPANPEGDLPRELSFDTRGPNPPGTLDPLAIADERSTYHYLYRLIFRLYRHAYGYEDARKAKTAFPELPPIAPGWEQQKVYYLRYPLIQGGEGERVTPFAVSAVKGDRMLLVFRGTTFQEEWVRDWQYQYSTDPLAAQLFPGKVHSGVFSIFKMTYAQIEQEVLRVGPRHVLVGGHSLGGVNAILHGFHIQDVLNQQAPLPPRQVDVVTIGAPLVGDPEFVDASGRMINQRSVVYVGLPVAGARGVEDLRIGDPIPQYTCGPFLGCDSLGTGPDGTLWPYGRPPCLIPFTSRDLGNNNRWLKAESLFYSGSAQRGLVASMRSIASCHVCSYMCWLSKAAPGGGDDYSLCYFKDQQDQVKLPDDKLCHFPDIPL